MNIIEPSVKFIDTVGLKKIELIGKVCTQQGDGTDDCTANLFCTMRLKDGHLSIFEHEYAYYDVSKVKYEILNEFLKLSPYIRVSYDRNIIGLSYRTIIDILCRNRMMNNRANNIIYDDDVNDLYVTISYKTSELDDLLYDKPYYDIENNEYMRIVQRLSYECVKNLLLKF